MISHGYHPCQPLRFVHGGWCRPESAERISNFDAEDKGHIRQFEAYNSSFVVNQNQFVALAYSADWSQSRMCHVWNLFIYDNSRHRYRHDSQVQIKGYQHRLPHRNEAIYVILSLPLNAVPNTARIPLPRLPYLFPPPAIPSSLSLSILSVSLSLDPLSLCSWFWLVGFLLFRNPRRGGGIRRLQSLDLWFLFRRKLVDSPIGKTAGAGVAVPSISRHESRVVSSWIWNRSSQESCCSIPMGKLLVLLVNFLSVEL